MIFQLNPNDFRFPDPSLAESDGLLAIGGDLNPERLLIAYKLGIFPWYSDDTPILWYAPHERFVLPTDQIKISKSMQQAIRSNRFRCTHNEDFAQVIRQCSSIERKDQDGTWITNDMMEAFTALHRLGFAHSIEVWNHEGKMIGGLYGILIGRVFSGESMFSLESNSSKYALIHLAKSFDIDMIDCQIHSAHLESMGATMIPQSAYLNILEKQGYLAHGLILKNNIL